MAERERWRQFESTAVIHLDCLFDVALRLCGKRAAAEELVYETYLRSFRYSEPFDAASNCRVWLLTILHDTFIAGLKSEGPQGIEPVGSDADTSRGGGSGVRALITEPDVEWLQRVEAADLAEALDRLPVESRELVVLADLEACSYEEIAQICGVPTESVGSRLSRARQLFRAVLAATFSDRKAPRGQP